MNILIYILFLAAKGINLLANVTASQKSCFLGLVLGLTWEKDELGLENGTSAVQCSPQLTYTKRVCPEHVFSIFWTVVWRIPFTKRNKIRIYSVSNVDKYEFGSSWTLRIMGRLGVFSLQSATAYAESGVEDHKPLSNAEEGEESFDSLQDGPQQNTGAKWVSAASPSKTSFLPWRKSVLLESHCLLYTCSTGHHSEITRMITFTCTPLNRTKQIQASLLRADWGHHFNQAERSLQEQPSAHLSHTLTKAPALGWAVAHLHSWSKPGFDTSSSHWKCQMRSRWLGWE